MPSLDHGSYSGADTTVTVAGWGVTTEDGSSPDVLHSVDLTLLTNAQCENYGYSGDLVDSMICAIGDLEGVVQIAPTDLVRVRCIREQAGRSNVR